MSHFKTTISKETFKLALTECIKKAWIWDSRTNFEHALNWHKKQLLTFEVESALEEADDFDNSAVSIDLFEAYLNLDNYTPEQFAEFNERWNDAWASPDGFDLSAFKGETIEDGLAFGEKVQEYFDMLNHLDNERYKTDFKTLNLADFKFQAAEAQTIAALQNPAIKYLYEAAFSFDEQHLRVKCDVLKIKPNKHVEIYEAKATTKVKKNHFFDLLYQVYVLEKNGFIVDNVYIVRLNADYIKNWHQHSIPTGMSLGDYAKTFAKSFMPIDYKQIALLVTSDFTVEANDTLADLNLLELIAIDSLSPGSSAIRNTLLEDIQLFKDTIGLDTIFISVDHYLSIIPKDDEIPAFLLAPKCAMKIEKTRGKTPQFIFSTSKVNDACCFHVMEWFDKEQQGFWTINGLNKNYKADLILHSPSPYFKDYHSLTDPSIKQNYKHQSYLDKNVRAQRIFEVCHAQLAAPHNLKAWNIIDAKHLELIQALLTQYTQFPVYMYDFETAKWAIPRFNKTNPYFQVPFQYSIDVIVNHQFDYNQPDTMFHYEFLSTQVDVDPRPQFIEHFIKDCFKHGPGVYVAYNDSFEKGVLCKLALMFPQYAKPLLYIVEHTIDLMHFFKASKEHNIPYFLIYHPDFLGSCSIKKTQPSLDASFSYRDLVINKGDKASETFRKFVDGNIPIKAWNLKISEGMLKYCNRDTLAMVVILRKITDLMKELYG